MAAMNPVGEAIGVQFDTRGDQDQTTAMQEIPCLAECVRLAVRRYLDDRGDHPPDDLHAFVVAEIEKPLLEEAMAWAEGNQSRCAELMGLSRGTLRKKLKTYQLI